LTSQPDPLTVITSETPPRQFQHNARRHPHGRQQASPRRKYRVDDPGFRRPLRQHVDQPARLQIVLDHERWKLTDTDPAQHRQAQRHHVLGDEARLVPDYG
jgi:hypothetical protein